MLLKRQPHITSTVHLYRSDIQTTSTFSIFDTGVKKRISDIIFEIIDQHTHDYYCIVTEGWSPASPSIKIEIEEAGYKHGDMARMPMHKKKEVLIIDGKTNDGKESRSECTTLLGSDRKMKIPKCCVLKMDIALMQLNQNGGPLLGKKDSKWMNTLMSILTNYFYLP